MYRYEIAQFYFAVQELERTLALLAFEDPTSCPFSDLLAPAHRQQVLAGVYRLVYSDGVMAG